MGKIITNILALVFGLSAFISCNSKQKTSELPKNDEIQVVQKAPEALKNIYKKKILKVVVDYNSTNYFVYRGVPMGFTYEILRELAKELDVKLEIVVSNNMQETFDGLRNGRYDLIAKNLTITKERNEIISFTEPFEQTRQVLVQRLPDDFKSMTQEDVSKTLVRSQLDLIGKTVHVQKNTAYYQRLLNLSQEIGGAINIVEDTIYGVEKLIGLVASGEIDYTVCDENVATVNQTYYSGLDILTPISFNQNIAWAVNKDSELLLKFINTWLISFKRTALYNIIYHKYFLSHRTKIRAVSEYHSIAGGKISIYDDIVRDISEKNGWDWRLVSSVIFTESGFDPEVESWTGAIGLMQLMPSTADFFDVENVQDPTQNIEGGVKMLSWLNDYFEPTIADSSQRVKFVLAAYNVGLGHVKDAQRLAKKYKKDPHIWSESVDFYILNKSAQKYFKDPVVRWGYCRGEETYDYVLKVINTYEHYLNVISN